MAALGDPSNYDRLARWYDLLAGGSERELRSRALDLLAVQPGEAALDLGCGTGQALVDMAWAVGRQGLALGLDRSTGMLGRARLNLLAGRTGEGKAELVKCDGRSLSIQTGGLDAALMTFSLELFEELERQQVLGEVRRALKPGGRLCILAMALPQKRSLVSSVYAWAHRQVPNWVDCRPIDTAGELHLAGFSVVTTRRGDVWSLPVEIVLANRP
jgi:ubiquinone/menaquinone biosynthesis C-methylase UbiE